MDFKEIKNKTPQEIEKIVNDLKEELRGLRFKAGAQSLKQNHKISETKKNIARLQTELKLRESNK
ncbi:MAG TPA: 50S ribosomal protein L29 [Candidatus Magasanikbacteria bacterium]|nr:50S ribosomal protein L29 [Candidatus Magasanikbacteria bacterium]